MPNMVTRLDHVGVVVDNLDDAKKFLGNLGLQLSRELTLPDRLRAAFYRCGEVEIELVEVTEPNERRQRLGTANARVEHIALEVENLVHTMRELARLGVRTTAPEPFVLGASRSYWTEPGSSDGVMYQLIEKA